LTRSSSAIGISRKRNESHPLLAAAYRDWRSIMQLGMIGLGRMGANMVRRLIQSGHDCVVCDAAPRAVADLEKDKATGASSLADLIGKLLCMSPQALCPHQGAP